MKKMIIAAGLLLLIGTSRAAQTAKPPVEHNILSSQLPTALRTSIKSTYSTYWITGLRSEGTNKHAKYTLTLEDADHVVQLRASGKGQWELVSTIAKEA
jgi:uncharacterized lipoprotein YmbA